MDSSDTEIIKKIIPRFNKGYKGEFLRLSDGIDNNLINYCYKTKKIKPFNPTYVLIDGLKFINISFQHIYKEDEIDSIEKIIDLDVNILTLIDIRNTSFLGDLSKFEKCYSLHLYFSNGTICDKIKKFPANIKYLYIYNYNHPLDNLPDGIICIHLTNYYSHLNILPLSVQYLIITGDFTFNYTFDYLPHTIKVIYLCAVEFAEPINYLPMGLEEFYSFYNCLEFNNNWPTNVRIIKFDTRCHPMTLENLPHNLEEFGCFLTYKDVDKLILPYTCQELDIIYHNKDKNVECKIREKFPFLKKIKVTMIYGGIYENIFPEI